MAKTLIKIAIALVVIHGALRVGYAFWNYYRFEDALLQVAQFGDRRTERQLCDEAMSAAADYDLPLVAADLTIRRGANPPYNCQGGLAQLQSDARGIPSAQLTIEGTYVDRLQVLPGYFYPWEFTPSASARLRF
jgi:hypothetical protein